MSCLVKIIKCLPTVKRIKFIFSTRPRSFVPLALPSPCSLRHRPPMLCSSLPLGRGPLRRLFPPLHSPSGLGTASPLRGHFPHSVRSRRASLLCRTLSTASVFGYLTSFPIINETFAFWDCVSYPRTPVPCTAPGTWRVLRALMASGSQSAEEGEKRILRGKDR